MIKTIIFDFGRVISAQKPASLFAAYEAELGLAPGMLNRIMFESPHWEDACLGRIHASDFWHAVGPRIGLTSREAIETFSHRYHADESINSDVLSIIKHLHSRYKLAILSNNPPGLKQWLTDWNILSLFSEVFCSGDEGVMKPDPKAFLIPLARLDTTPEAALFIDDTMTHVRAAENLGIHAIHFTTASALQKSLEAILP